MLLFFRRNQPNYFRDKYLLAASFTVGACSYLYGLSRSNKEMQSAGLSILQHAFVIFATDNPFFRAGAAGGMIAKLLSPGTGFGTGLQMGSVLGATFEVSRDLMATYPPAVIDNPAPGF